MVTGRKVLNLCMHTLCILDVCIDDDMGTCIMP